MPTVTGHRPTAVSFASWESPNTLLEIGTLKMKCYILFLPRTVVWKEDIQWDALNLKCLVLFVPQNFMVYNIPSSGVSIDFTHKLIATGSERTLRYVSVCMVGNEALVTLRFAWNGTWGRPRWKLGCNWKCLWYPEKIKEQKPIADVQKTCETSINICLRDLGAIQGRWKIIGSIWKKSSQMHFWSSSG
jgi:hypothetical protein